MQNQQLSTLFTRGEDWIVIYEPWYTHFRKVISSRPSTNLLDIDQIYKKKTSAKTLLIIGPPFFANPYKALALRHLFNVPVGLITGETVEEAYEHFCRCNNIPLYTYDKDILIDRTERGVALRVKQRWIFPEGSIERAEDTLELVQKESRLLAITAHGRDDVVYMPMALLCGRNSAFHQQSDLRSLLPACATTKECFYRGRTLISPDRLNARIVYLNSCKSFSGKAGLFHAEYALDTALLQNKSISHIVGSPIIHHGETTQAEFLSIFLDLGFSLGQSVEIIDEIITAREMDVKSLLIYGDPSISFPPLQQKAQMVVVDSDTECSLEIMQDLVLVSCQPVSQETLLILEAPCSVKVFPCHLGYLLYSREGLVPGTYKWSYISLKDFIQKITAELVLPIQHLKHLKFLGLHPHKISGRILDLENRYIQARKNILDIVIEHSSKGLERTLEKVKRTFVEIDQVISDVVIDTSSKDAFHISEIYRIECVTRAVHPLSTPCKLCGNPVQEVLWEHRVESTFARRTLQCFRCGYLSDQPAFSPLKAELQVYDEIVRLGSRLDVVLRFDIQPTEKCIAVCILLSTAIYEVQPVYEKKVLEVGQVQEQFSLNIPLKLPPHHFWLRTYVISYGAVHSWGANVWLIP